MSAEKFKTLWDEFRMGNETALVYLYKMLFQKLLTYGVQLCNNHEIAKDALNDVFSDLWGNRGKLNKVDNVQAYLYACMRRKIFQQINSWNKVIPFPQETMRQLKSQEVELSHEDLLIAIQRTDEMNLKIKNALSNLTVRQRELIHMKYYQNLSYEQIEAATGMSKKTAYNTIYNAIKALAGELRDTLLSLVFILLFGK